VFEGDPLRSPLYKDVSNGVMPGGIEYYLPLFFEHTATLADYLPKDAAIALVGDITDAVEHFWQDTESRYKLLRGDHSRPLLPPTEVFLPPDAFNASLKPHPRIEVPLMDAGTADADSAKAAKLPSVQVDRRADDPLVELKRYLATGNARVLICAESAGRRETMQQYFAEYGLKVPLADDWRASIADRIPCALVVSPLHSGFAWPQAKLAFVTEAELYAGVVRRGRRDSARRSNVDSMLRDLSEVRIGDPVVHEEHGIGRYLGLVAMDLGEGPAEFLQLVYANDAKLYVPVANLHLIGRYSGASLTRRRCTSLAARSGTRRRSAPRGRHMTPRPSSSICTRNAHRAWAARSSSASTTTRRSPKASRSRRRPTSRRRSRR
jgi:transcription-repair coupling factor (superfamily II helicase)